MFDAINMALYDNKRVLGEYDELLRQHPGRSITTDDLITFDQMHYLGTEPLDAAAKILPLINEDKILDVGAGYGGPARYLASRFGCQIVCLEKQLAIHEVGERFTSEVGLSGQVRHIHGDILFDPLPGTTFDHLISLLTILHIADKASAFHNMSELHKPGGKIFIEDFYKIGDFSADERRELQEIVACPPLPTREEYVRLLRTAGFRVIEFIDMLEPWQKFVQERVEAFVAAKRRHTRVYGQEIVQRLDTFYHTVMKLFQGGHLGGVRLIAVRT